MWNFIQNQVLSMKWLNVLAGKALTACGIDIASRLGGSLQFFIFDVINIVILLATLIFVISYIQSYFPPERTKKIHCQSRQRPARNSNAVLQLFVHPAVHRLHKRRAASGRYVFVPDLVAAG